ncbi:TfoX/Sxy family protein [Marinobacter sediminum]|uniref:TfoX/Sxy family protein n=1 Tax=Marinobacter sediminum TaxID=256323 RepID=UPI00356373BE
MKAASEFVKNLNDVFALFGAVEARRMFGGYGIYHDGLMFALVADDVLYLKVDDSTSGEFVELGLQQFEYEKNGKVMRMSYYAAPEEIFDDLEQAREWAEKAYGAASRARKPK